MFGSKAYYISDKIPDRWDNYKSIGKRIEGTPFIPFKVPLSTDVSDGVNNEKYRLDFKTLFEKVPNLGCIIDLTNTNKYYSPNVFSDKPVQYIKIQTEGLKVPNTWRVQQFVNFVNSYLATSDNKDTLIGVHCTHGVNRTGFFICKYMITCMNISPDDAIARFEKARGYPIERPTYIDDLKSSIMGILSYESDITSEDDFNESVYSQKNDNNDSDSGDTTFSDKQSDKKNGPLKKRSTDGIKDDDRETLYQKRSRKEDDDHKNDDYKNDDHKLSAGSSECIEKAK